MTKLKEKNRVRTIILKDFTLVIVFKGLKTLIALKLLTEKLIVMTKGRREVDTIIKSKTFQASFK